MTGKEAQSLVDIAGMQLGEHFEAVVVLASYSENGYTILKKIVVGNWHAGQGMAHDFINTNQGEIAAEQIQKVLPPAEPPDDSDDWKKTH